MKQTEPIFYLNINSETIAPYISANQLSRCAKLENVSVEGNTQVLTYHDEGERVEIKVCRESFDGLETTRQRVTVKNISCEDIVVDALSSLYVNSIGSCGNRMWHEDRFLLHRCDFTWQGEGQWRVQKLDECGLYPTYNHDNHAIVRMINSESWSTCNYYPMVMLEDTERGEIWYFEQESSGPWTIEICSEGYQKQSALCVFLSSAYERGNGWFVNLAPGESYTTKSAIFGCVKGGFEDAVRELTRYKRKTKGITWESLYPPVCFNDYMNCLWALPTKEKLIPLIDKASEVGCEIFCIDDGWFKSKEGEPDGLGTWRENDSLFGEGGFKSIIEYIASKGMKPGVWLEMESASAHSYIAKNIENSIMRRHGKLVGGSRCPVNFLNSEVREYIEGVIDHLYSLGVRFIKNDYNQSGGVGFDHEKYCMSEIMMKNSVAFLEFIDNIQTKYPDLCVESCASGAMRCDNETLSHFRVQSTTDQEFYEYYPSILSGMQAIMPPETAGVWVYPYPVPIQKRDFFVDNAEFASKFESGAQTVFNMVTGMFGCLYMSGKITNADKYNTSLIVEGVDMYKSIRDMIPLSYPIYPTGTRKMAENGFLTFGLMCEEKKTIMLGVWKKNTSEMSFTLDMSRYAEKFETMRVYPNSFEGLSYTVCGANINISFPDESSAIYFVLKY